MNEENKLVESHCRGRTKTGRTTLFYKIKPQKHKTDITGKTQVTQQKNLSNTTDNTEKTSKNTNTTKNPKTVVAAVEIVVWMGRMGARWSHRGDN